MSDKPKIALTFDDGPSEFTPRILDALEKHNARASFFVLGHKVEEGKKTIQRAFETGNEIISHSWSHCKNPNLSELSAAAIKKELTDTRDAIKSAINDWQNGPDFFRPPYGAVSDTLKKVSAELNYSIINWSLDTMDWENKNADIIFIKIMSKIRAGDIILCHDVYPSTAEAMERVIPTLLCGYELVTLSQLFKYSYVKLKPGEVYTEAYA